MPTIVHGLVSLDRGGELPLMLKPGDQLGDWVVEAALGEGAMGAVYRAHSIHSERLKAAVKVMKPSSEPEAAARFVREAEALTALSHPVVVRVMGSAATRAEASPTW